MPRGENIKKGERLGGRQKGTLNKKTVERLGAERVAFQAQQEVNKAALKNVKLGKDVLEDYTFAFAALAGFYQNQVVKALQASTEPTKADLAGFEKWGRLTAETAKSLADFQSPKFKAIAVMAPPPEIPHQKPGEIDGKVVPLHDAVALARIYAQTMKQVRG